MRVKKIIMLLVGVIVLIGLTSCNSRETIKSEDINKIVEDSTYLMNLRYYGYTDESVDRIDNILPGKSEYIIDKISQTSSDTRVFISLEEYFKECEETIVQEESDTGELVEYNPYIDKPNDPNIETVNGIRGVYSDNIYIENGKFVTVIYGQTLYIPVTSDVYKYEMLGNPEYKFKCTNYNYYDNGNLIMEFETDLEGAFVDIYGKVKVVEDESEEAMGTGSMDIIPDVMTSYEYASLKNSFMESNKINKVALKVKVMNSNILDVDLDKLTDRLEVEQ